MISNKSQDANAIPTVKVPSSSPIMNVTNYGRETFEIIKNLDIECCCSIRSIHKSWPEWIAR